MRHQYEYLAPMEHDACEPNTMCTIDGISKTPPPPIIKLVDWDTAMSVRQDTDALRMFERMIDAQNKRSTRK